MGGKKLNKIKKLIKFYNNYTKAIKLKYNAMIGR